MSFARSYSEYCDTFMTLLWLCVGHATAFCCRGRTCYFSLDETTSYFAWVFHAISSKSVNTHYVIFSKFYHYYFDTIWKQINYVRMLSKSYLRHRSVVPQFLLLNTRPRKIRPGQKRRVVTTEGAIELSWESMYSHTKRVSTLRWGFEGKRNVRNDTGLSLMPCLSKPAWKLHFG